MRRFGLIIFTLAVITAGFLIYLKMQPSIRVSDRRDSSTVPGGGVLATNPSGTIVGHGKDTWVNQYDTQGRLIYRSKVHDFKNYGDGRADLQNPETEIFKNSGEVIRIEGENGTVHVDPGTDQKAINGAPLRPPRDGFLNNVTVKVFPSIAARDAETPTLTLTTNNARFDTATNRLFTESFAENGKHYSSDEVPVTVVGHDLNRQRDTFSFKGSGLVLDWNEREDRIKTLEIAHGKELVVYDMSLLTTVKKNPEASTKPAIGPTPAAPSAPSTPAAPVNPTAGHDSATLPVVPRQDRYLATFLENVHVLEDGVETITSDTMAIDFAIRTEQATTAVAPTTDNTPRASAVLPSTQPTVAVASPVSLPEPGPKDSGPHQVIIHWSGKLRLLPNDAAADPPPRGQAVVTFTGQPVKVHRPNENGHNGYDVLCQGLAYHTADGRLSLAGDAAAPVHITEQRPDGRGAIVDAQSIDYSRSDSKAILHGRGSLSAPDPNKPESRLQSTWTQGCVLNLLVQPDNNVQVSRADLNGNVAVDHPRFHLDSGELSLWFDPKSTADSHAQATSKDLGKSLELRHIVANSSAVVVLHEADGKQRSISAQHLDVTTKRDADGSLYADTVSANGKVLASEDNQSLSAGNLRADLAPIPAAERQHQKPAADSDALENSQVRLKHLLATDDVVLQGKDQSQGRGDKLEITMDGSDPTVVLFGKSGADAMVKGKDSTVTGPKITLIKKDQKCTVDGAGKMDTLQQPHDPKGSPRPLHLTWTESAAVDGKVNAIDVHGKVQAQSNEANGSRDLAQTDQLHLNLVDKPKDPAATQPSKSADDQFAFARDKQVSDLSLIGDQSNVVTTLSAPNGAILKRSAIFGQRIDYDVVHQKLVIPGSGSMLEEEHVVGDYKPENPGATAIQWQKQFVFENASQQATVDGQVLMVHRDDGANQQRTSVHGDQVAVTFAPEKAPQTAPADLDPSPHLQIKKVVVQGNVLIDLGDTKIESSAVEFMPADHRLICRGDDDLPVVVHDENHKSGATFGEVWINVQTNTIERLTNLSAHGHR